jgi:hypothetical protein
MTSGIESVLRDQVAAAHNRQTDELRRAARGAAQQLADRIATRATFRLVLEGDGGGEWFLVIRDGEMRVTESDDEPPLISVYQTVDGWQRLHAAGAAMLGAGGGRVQLTPDRVTRLRALRGALEFRLTEVDASDGVTVVLQLGGDRGRVPSTTVITLRAADAMRMRSGELPPPQAMMQGLVQLAGDVSFAVQVGTALLM